MSAPDPDYRPRRFDRIRLVLEFAYAVVRIGLMELTDIVSTRIAARRRFKRKRR